MSWNLEGLHVTGMYMGEYQVSGLVELSRVKYGGGVQHTVVLDKPLSLRWAVRDRVLLDQQDVIRVMSRSAA